MSVAQANRGSAALALRIAGASYAEIADVLALTDAQSALAVVTRELSETVDVEHREQLRAEESERLLTMLGPVLARALNPQDAEQLQAARTALAIVDRRIRLLGLDAPTEIAIHTPTATELETWVARMSAPNLGIIDADIVELDQPAEP